PPLRTRAHATVSLLLYYYRTPHDSPSFPTRRSSDLDVERMGLDRQFDELHELTVGRGTGELKPRLGELLAVGVVDFVAVPVAFADRRRTVDSGDDAAFGELRFVGAQAHGPAEVALPFDDGQLLGHGRDD